MDAERRPADGDDHHDAGDQQERRARRLVARRRPRPPPPGGRRPPRRPDERGEVAKRSQHRSPLEQQGEEAPRDEEAEAWPDQPGRAGPEARLFTMPLRTSQGASTDPGDPAPSSMLVAVRSPIIAPVESMSGLQLTPDGEGAGRDAADRAAEGRRLGDERGRPSRNQVRIIAVTAAPNSSRARGGRSCAAA